MNERVGKIDTRKKRFCFVYGFRAEATEKKKKEHSMTTTRIALTHIFTAFHIQYKGVCLFIIMSMSSERTQNTEWRWSSASAKNYWI